jgi:hypothetical protein
MLERHGERCRDQGRSERIRTPRGEKEPPARTGAKFDLRKEKVALNQRRPTQVPASPLHVLRWERGVGAAVWVRREQRPWLGCCRRAPLARSGLLVIHLPALGSCRGIRQLGRGVQTLGEFQLAWMGPPSDQKMRGRSPL